MRCVVELGFKLRAIYLQSLDLKLFSICITEGIAHSKWDGSRKAVASLEYFWQESESDCRKAGPGDLATSELDLGHWFQCS